MLSELSSILNTFAASRGSLIFLSLLEVSLVKIIFYTCLKHLFFFKFKNIPIYCLKKVIWPHQVIFQNVNVYYILCVFLLRRLISKKVIITNYRDDFVRNCFLLWKPIYQENLTFLNCYCKHSATGLAFLLSSLLSLNIYLHY